MLCVMSVTRYIPSYLDVMRFSENTKHNQTALIMNILQSKVLAVTFELALMLVDCLKTLAIEVLHRKEKLFVCEGLHRAQLIIRVKVYTWKIFFISMRKKRQNEELWSRNFNWKIYIFRQSSIIERTV